MKIAARPIISVEKAAMVGYRKVMPGNDDEFDDVTQRPEHRGRYPGQRKSLDLAILDARDKITARSAPGAVFGGICHGDSGSALFLEDGSIAGTVITATNDI